MIHRLLLSLSGEGLQSGFHFLLSLFLIRLMGVHDFGLFAIIFVLGGVSLTYGNALISVPASVEIARTKRRCQLNTQEVLFGTIAVLVSIFIGATGAGVLFLTLGHPLEAISGGLFVGCWALRNHVRTILFARREAGAATVSDLVYSIGGITSVATQLWFGTQSSRVAEIMFGLSLANAVAMGAAFWVAKRWPRIRFHRKVFDVFRSIRKDVAWSFLTATTWTLQSQGLTFLIAATAGPDAYAPVAAGALLFAPLRPAICAIVNVFRPHFAKAFSEGHGSYIRGVGFGLTAGIVFCCLILGGLIWTSWAYIDTYIFYKKFDISAMQIIVGLSGFSALLYLTYTVPLTIFQAAGQFRPVAVATILGSATCLASVSVLLAAAPVEWSLIGVVLGEAACGLYLWITAGRLLRRRDKLLSDARSDPTRSLAVA